MLPVGSAQTPYGLHEDSSARRSTFKYPRSLRSGRPPGEMRCSGNVGKYSEFTRKIQFPVAISSRDANNQTPQGGWGLGDKAPQAKCAAGENFENTVNLERKHAIFSSDSRARCPQPNTQGDLGGNNPWSKCAAGENFENIVNLERKNTICSSDSRARRPQPNTPGKMKIQ